MAWTLARYPSRDCPLNDGDILTVDVLHQAFPGQPTGTRNLVAGAHGPALSVALLSR